MSDAAAAGHADLPVPANVLAGLERDVQRALDGGDPGRLQVIGYGEVNTVLKLRWRSTEYACKRLIPFPDPAGARRAAEVIGLYVDGLAGRGIDVAETQTAIVPGRDGDVVYCVQPAWPALALGPEHVRRLGDDEALGACERIFTVLGRAVAPTIAPDGQLSNWVFTDGGLVYVDVGSPFLRDEEGRELFDFEHQTRILPVPLRLAVRRFLLRRILDKYYTLRGQALDFLGNLRKEGLDRLVPPLVPLANRAFRLEPPVRESDVHAYYAIDARTYALIHASLRADRWVRRRVLRRSYPYLLPPRVERRL
jgi:hypothetical protein